MKVLMINNLYYPNQLGGAERVVQSLAESLVQTGHQVSVACVSPGDVVQTKELNGVTVHYLGVSSSLWPYRSEANPKHVKLLWKTLDSLRVGMVRGLDRLLDREKPDVVHSHNLAGFSVAVWHAAKARRLPLVHNLHDYSLLCARSSMFKSEKNCARQCAGCRLFSFSKRTSSDLVDAVVGVSRFVLERHLQYRFFPCSKQQEVIFNGYESRIQLATGSRQGAVPLRLGYLGRLQPSKGVEWLLGVLQDLPFEAWEIWLAGTGEAGYVEQLKRRYTSSRVHFLGFIPPEELFARIDVLLVPSLWHEPFGRIIIEAYAHGVPVIAAKRGGIPEVVDDGRTGFLFDPDSPSSLPTAIGRYAAEPQLAAQMRPLALQKAEEFSMGRMVDRYLAVYDRARITTSFQTSPLV